MQRDTVRVMIDHFSTESATIEGQLEALVRLSERISDMIVGDEPFGDTVHPGHQAILDAIAHCQIMRLEAAKFTAKMDAGLI